MNQVGISIVRAGNAAVQLVFQHVEYRYTIYIAIDDEESTNTGDTDDKWNQNLQECSEYHTLLGLSKRLGRQTFLDDILVEAPVAHIGKP